jgi:hypothetical protein
LQPNDLRLPFFSWSYLLLFLRSSDVVVAKTKAAASIAPPTSYDVALNFDERIFGLLCE